MTDHPATPSILFVEKVLLRPRERLPLRGVELFNLCLLRDIAALGLSVTVLADRSWQPDLEQALKPHPHELVLAGLPGMDFLKGLVTAWKVRNRRFDVLVIGNVGNGIVPTIRLLQKFKTCRRQVLIAHREATARFVELMKGRPGSTLAVNGKIAGPFRAAGCPDVQVDYGIMNAGRFHPPASPRRDSGALRFCVIGMLDNAWKGSDTAVNAFRLLPGELRERAELHLCSFTQPPAFPEPRIKAYPWMDASKLPDLLRDMDVMIVPSRDEEVMRETFSQAIVQGMLTGLPVIVNDLPVLTEKLDHGGGLVFRNEAELAAHIATLIQQPGLRERLGAEGRRTALERYVWDTRRFVDTYIRPPHAR